MRIITDYKKIIVKVKGKWRYIYKPVYEDKGNGAGVEPSKDPTIYSVRGEVIKV